MCFVVICRWPCGGAAPGSGACEEHLFNATGSVQCLLSGVKLCLNSSFLPSLCVCRFQVSFISQRQVWASEQICPKPTKKCRFLLGPRPLLCVAEGDEALNIASSFAARVMCFAAPGAGCFAHQQTPSTYHRIVCGVL